MLFLGENFTLSGAQDLRVDHRPDHFPALEFFIPLLIGTGGNAGSQTVGTIIRGLALGEIQGRDALRVLLGEWLTGLLLGLMLGALGFFYAHLYRGQPWGVSAVIGLAILGICIWANASAPSCRCSPAVGHRPGRRLRPLHQHPRRRHRAGHLLHDRHRAAGADAMRESQLLPG